MARRLEALAAIPMSEFLYLLVVLILLSYWHTTILSQLRSLIVGCQSYGHSFISQNACYSRYVWLTADTVFDRNLPLS